MDLYNIGPPPENGCHHVCAKWEGESVIEYYYCGKPVYKDHRCMSHNPEKRAEYKANSKRKREELVQHRVSLELEVKSLLKKTRLKNLDEVHLRVKVARRLNQIDPILFQELLTEVKQAPKLVSALKSVLLKGGVVI
jgi:hypothetical protein